jgi:formylmethanofuran dehydrogenase subunit E
MNDYSLTTILAQSALAHDHLCPRQVLGARMGLWARDLLGVDNLGARKRLLAIVETDGCLIDGISAATGCTVGHRTMHIEDYGKVAATFVSLEPGPALRIVPSRDVRRLAGEWAPEASSPWQAQLLGYQLMPAEVLLSSQEVQLRVPLTKIMSKAGLKAICAVCGEEIHNEREMHRDGLTLCLACGGQSYYAALPDPIPAGAESLWDWMEQVTVPRA